MRHYRMVVIGKSFPRPSFSTSKHDNIVRISFNLHAHNVRLRVCRIFFLCGGKRRYTTITALATWKHAKTRCTRDAIGMARAQ